MACVAVTGAAAGLHAARLFPARAATTGTQLTRAWRARSPFARCARLHPPRRLARGQTIRGCGPRHVRRRAARRGAAGARPPWLPPRAAAARGALTRTPGPAQDDQGRDAEDEAWRHFQDVLRRPERGRYSGVVGICRAGRPLPGGPPRPAVPGLRVTGPRASRRGARCVLAAVMLAAELRRPLCSTCIVAGCST